MCWFVSQKTSDILHMLAYTCLPDVMNGCKLLQQSVAAKLMKCGRQKHVFVYVGMRGMCFCHCVAQVKVKPGMAILSLICNVERTSEILMRTFKVFIEEGINVNMMSQGASKVGVYIYRKHAVVMRAVPSNTVCAAMELVCWQCGAGGCSAALLRCCTRSSQSRPPPSTHTHTPTPTPPLLLPPSTPPP